MTWIGNDTLLNQFTLFPIYERISFSKQTKYYLSLTLLISLFVELEPDKSYHIVYINNIIQTYKQQVDVR